MNTFFGCRGSKQSIKVLLSQISPLTAYLDNTMAYLTKLCKTSYKYDHFTLLTVTSNLSPRATTVLRTENAYGWRE